MSSTVTRTDTLCVIKDVEEAKLFRNFKTIFSCSICLSYILEPRMTPCGHMFCSDCLHKWILSIYPHTRCPCCRESFKLDDTILMYSGESTKSTIRLRSNIRKKYKFNSHTFSGQRFCNMLLYEIDFSDCFSILSVISISVFCSILIYCLCLIVE